MQMYCPGIQQMGNIEDALWEELREWFLNTLLFFFQKHTGHFEKSYLFLETLNELRKYHLGTNLQ